MEILTNEDKRLRPSRRGRHTINQWDKWLKHNTTVRLIEGEDFTCRPQSIRQQAYNKAAELGGTVSVSIGTHPSNPEQIVVEITFREHDDLPVDSVSATG
jgi:hypothetical protein